MILTNPTGAAADRAALSDAVRSGSPTERQQAFNRSQFARDAIYVRRFPRTASHKRLIAPPESLVLPAIFVGHVESLLQSSEDDDRRGSRRRPCDQVKGPEKKGPEKPMTPSNTKQSVATLQTGRRCVNPACAGESGDVVRHR